MSYKESFESLAAGAMLVTVNERLARDLRLAYGQARAEAGEPVWERPRILGWQSWLSSCHAALADAAFGGGEAPAPLLGPAQALVLWEQVVADSPAARNLLQPSAAARLAAEAWNRMQDWELDLPALRSSGVADALAFADWAEDYARRVHRSGWLDPAELGALVAAAFADGRLTPPARLLLAGFDRLPPVAERLLAALRARGCEIQPLYTAPAQGGQQRRVGLPDTEHELRAAARWVRARLATDPSARIGIVVPDLSERRETLARVFGEELAPAAAAAAVPAALPFNISLGQPLDEFPVVAAAVLALDLIRGRVPVLHLGRLLRSPFLGEAERERAARARLDVRLREAGGLSAGVQWLARLAAEQAPMLGERLTDWLAWREAAARRQTAGAWAEAFATALRTLGWPGERSLDSTEHQAVQAFHGVLAQFADLDDWLGPLGATAALGQLRRALHERIFQPESAPTGVHVLGALEAAGQRFDHLWVLGLHDGVWPPAPRPHPLLPARLQRERGMPHASAERELAFAREVTARLLAAAPEVVVSWPRREGDAELRVSPLLAPVPECEPEALALAEATDWRARIGASAALEEFTDEQGPALPAGTEATGGTGLLRDQAACPFRAFASHRLHAQPVPSPVAGLDAAERGRLMHRVLEKVWGELHSHAALAAMEAAALQALVVRAVDTAVAQAARHLPTVLTPAVAAVESERIRHLVLAWLKLERARAPFTVAERELSAAVSVGPLELRTRVDRIDRLADGTLAVIDYKTGKVSAQSWFGERPDEPQLPLYACAVEDELGGVLFAQVRAGDLCFRGVTRGEDEVPGAVTLERMKTLPEEVDNWPALLVHWRTVLAALAEAYRAGEARVDPKTPRSCELCHLPSVCRIHERDTALDLETADD